NRFITYSSYDSHGTPISFSQSQRESRISAHSGLSSIMSRHSGLALQAFSMSAITHGALRGQGCASFQAMSHSGDGLRVHPLASLIGHRRIRPSLKLPCP
ncbi:hypothetical protein M758_UG154400, partial [Ceratodon purpureus]